MERTLAITAKDIQNINKLIGVDGDGRIRKIISQFAQNKDEEEVLMLKTTLLLEFGTPLFEEAPTPTELTKTDVPMKWVTKEDVLQDGHICAKPTADGGYWIFSLAALRDREDKQHPVIVYGSLLKLSKDGEVYPKHDHNTVGIGRWGGECRTATTKEAMLFYKHFPNEQHP